MVAFSLCNAAFTALFLGALPSPRGAAAKRRPRRAAAFDFFILRGSQELAPPAITAKSLRRDDVSLPPDQLLRGLPEHIASGLLVERLLDEFSDREPRLHLRPCADFGVPALDVRIIVERKALGFMR